MKTKDKNIQHTGFRRNGEARQEMKAQEYRKEVIAQYYPQLSRLNQRSAQAKGGVPRSGEGVLHIASCTARPCGVEDPSVLRTAPLSGGAINYYRLTGACGAIKLLRRLAACLLCLLTVLLSACQPDELMDNGSTAQPDSPATLVLDLGVKPGYEAEASGNSDISGISGTSGNSAPSTRTSPLTGQWQAGDCVTVRLTLYADDDATIPLDAAQTGNIGANSDGTLTQTLTCTAEGTSTPSTPAQWTAQPAVLPLPAAARALSAEYAYTGPEDPITHTRERITGTLAPRRIALTDADTQSPPDGRPRTLHLPAPQWTRRTALVQLCRLMPDRAILALTFASSDTPQAERDAAHATATYFIVAPPAQNPPEGMTADQYAAQGTIALLHLPCGVEDPSVLRTAPLSGGAISNYRLTEASDALPLFALSAIGQPTAPAFDALQNPDAARPYAPGWKRTVDDAETVFLRTGPDADAQGTIYGDGLNLLPTDLFNGLDNPRWIISGGGTDNYNNTGKTKNQTVGENVVTALKNIFRMEKPGPGRPPYDGTNGYVHLTLTDVTEVANDVFQYGTQLLSLNLPKAQSIGDNAFAYCDTLTTVSLPEVQSIGNSAFYGCALTTVNLPKVQNIGKEAFLGCTLTTVSLPAAQNIGSQAFRSCKALTTVSLPAAQSIGNNAFLDCDALTSISLPKAESIGNSAFYECEALTSISLPKAQSIEASAFNSCKALTTISLPEAQSIGNHAFYRCYALTTLSLPEAQSIGNDAFNSCEALTRLDISGVTDESKLDADAFYNSASGSHQFRPENCTLILNPALRSACTDADGGKTGPLVRFHDCLWKEIQFLE